MHAGGIERRRSAMATRPARAKPRDPWLQRRCRSCAVSGGEGVRDLEVGASGLPARLVEERSRREEAAARCAGLTGAPLLVEAQAAV